MGDMVDDLTDNGLTEWALHKAGLCDSVDECQYCRKEEQRKPKKETVDKND